MARGAIVREGVVFLHLSFVLFFQVGKRERDRESEWDKETVEIALVLFKRAVNSSMCGAIKTPATTAVSLLSFSSFFVLRPRLVPLFSLLASFLYLLHYTDDQWVSV